MGNAESAVDSNADQENLVQSDEQLSNVLDAELQQHVEIEIEDSNPQSNPLYNEEHAYQEEQEEQEEQYTMQNQIQQQNQEYEEEEEDNEEEEEDVAIRMMSNSLSHLLRPATVHSTPTVSSSVNIHKRSIIISSPFSTAATTSAPSESSEDNNKPSAPKKNKITWFKPLPPLVEDTTTSSEDVTSSIHYSVENNSSSDTDDEEQNEQVIVEIEQSDQSSTLIDANSNIENEPENQTTETAMATNGKYTIDAIVDCLLPSTLTLHVGAHVTASLLCDDSIASKVQQVYQLDAGLNQSISKEIDLSAFEFEELLYDKSNSPNYYPFVLQIQSNKSTEGETCVSCQTTFAALERNNDTLSLKVVRVAVDCSGKLYNVFDIYGIEEQHQDTFGATDCVICMCEPRNTTLLPCRHMCMCSDCAEMFRTRTNKCPICRSFVSTLLKIDRHNDSNKNDEKQRNSIELV